MVGMVRSKASSFPGSESLPTSVAITGRDNFLSRAPQELVPALSRWIPRYTALCSALGFPFPWERSRLLHTHYLVRRISRRMARIHLLPAPTVADWIITSFPW